MKYIVLFAKLAFFLLLFVPSSSGLGVEGVIFEAEAAPGQHVDHEMTVSLRDNEAPMDLQVNIQDWGQTLDGSNQEMDDGAKPSCSARSFLRASPASFHLEPGESQKVLVEGDIPEDAGSGGKYALISVHSLPTVEEDDEGSEGNVGVAVAINALVRLTISGTELLRKGEITDMRIEDPSCEHQNISLIFNNTGNYHYKACAKVALKDEEGNLLANSSSPLSSNIIPSASRIFSLSLIPEKELLPGAYCISATIEEEGGSLLAAKETEIEIKNSLNPKCIQDNKYG